MKHSWADAEATPLARRPVVATSVKTVLRIMVMVLRSPGAPPVVASWANPERAGPGRPRTVVAHLPLGVGVRPLSGRCACRSDEPVATVERCTARQGADMDTTAHAHATPGLAPGEHRDRVARRLRQVGLAGTALLAVSTVVAVLAGWPGQLGG